MIVGTAGHIDHGKTALVKALTGIDADRLPEEKARGITLDLGFAYADLGGGQVTGFVDVPGHERLIHTMVAGAGGIDLALLVVAADDGVMPQTREHLAILSLLGLTRAIVALTKVDLADPARRAAVTAAIAALLAGTALADAPVIAVSSRTGEGIDALRGALVRAEAETPPRPAAGPFRLVIDRAFSLTGAGTVVTGTVLSGRIRPGDTVTIGPAGLAARVRGLHAQNRPADEARAGQRCALNLVGEGIGRTAIRRGDVAQSPALHAPTARIDATLRLLAPEPKLTGGRFAVRLHCHAAEAGAQVVALAEAAETAGPAAAVQLVQLVQLVLDRPVAVAVGDRFLLRDPAAGRTLGGGRFLDLRPPARRRRSPARLAHLAAAAREEPAAALAGMLAVGPVPLGDFLRDRVLADGEGPALLAAVGGVERAGLALSATAVAALCAEAEAVLADFHAANPDLFGMARDRLRQGLDLRLPKDPFLALLHDWAAAGRIVPDGAFLRLPGHEIRLAPAEEALLARIWPGLTGADRFRPPRVRDFASALDRPEAEVRHVLRLSQRLGRTDQIAPDHFFARAVTAEMAALAAALSAQAPDGWFLAAAFRDRLQNGRKVAIQILEFLDRHRVTLRRGDRRRINPLRADQFGP
ncbi:MAG: selenocysteine-specific translation elongation factor [Rhodobacteraceae bacterium]|jgi:selenocysteine-specific elongation factor|nr:selenocysteine-specific translation elongation factor [Paracoccaceae bacterium]